MMSLPHIRSIRNRSRLLLEIEQIFDSRIGQSGLTFRAPSRIIDVVSKSLTLEIGHLMINMEKNFSRSNQETYRHGAESAARCEDCATFSGWFGTHEEDRLARWESQHRCGAMITRNAASRDAVELEPVITREEYITLELAYLFAQLKAGNEISVASSIATINQQLHYVGLGLSIDPDDVCARIATSNGVYRRWSYLQGTVSK